METVDREFLAWLAGFWEGEGCFYLSIKGGETKTSFRIGQNNREPLDLIQSRLGIGYVQTFKPGGFNQKIHYEWVVASQNEVIKIVDLLLPFLKFRKTEIQHKLDRLRVARDNSKCRHFTHEEVKYITENWRKPDKEIAAILNRTEGSIVWKRKKLGFNKGLGWAAKSGLNWAIRRGSETYRTWLEKRESEGVSPSSA